jgi:chorismate synthase
MEKARMTLTFLSAGESHGPGYVSILDGLPAGLSISISGINHELSRRQKGSGSGPRMKIEKDAVRVLAGVMEGKTNGAPVAFFVENLDHKKWRGRKIAPFNIPRPGHADLTGAIKFGFDDLRFALERSSARETVARVAAGAMCKQFLQAFGIEVGGYVTSIAEVVADVQQISIVDRFKLAESNDVRCPDPGACDKMQDRIQQAIHARDTLGGVIEVVALGLPPGLGSYTQWHQRLEARLGSAVLSVPAIKGVEIGDAFENTRLPGTQAHDAIYLEGERLTRGSNRAGGIEGGITNGMALVIRAAMKPIATTLTPQPSVDLSNPKEVLTAYERSDFCPVPRAVPILEAMIAFTLSAALLDKLGGDSMPELIDRFERLRKATTTDLRLADQERIFWTDDSDGTG